MLEPYDVIKDDKACGMEMLNRGKLFESLLHQARDLCCLSGIKANSRAYLAVRMALVYYFRWKSISELQECPRCGEDLTRYWRKNGY